jgi:DNA sulfur modification protein DndE
MTWRTFGGEYADVYEALLKMRCLSEGLDLAQAELSQLLRCHIYRGIGYLAANKRITNIADLVSLVGKPAHH